MKHLYLLKSAILAGFLFSAACVNAQMVGTSAFLKGQYLELGIGAAGFYGSSDPIPAGYHPHSGGILGFVADPAMDGWTVGTPAYMGDYFVPGSPFEGWELQVNGKRVQGYGPGASCCGSNVSCGMSGSVVTSTWQGLFDSVQLTQITSFDTNSLYFNIKIILTNTAVAAKNDIYYLRTLDPDNDQSWPGGSFSTDNKIDYQAKDTTVVTATGRSATMPPLSLGTTDTNATAFVYSAWPLTSGQDLAAVYNMTYSTGAGGYVPGVTYAGDIGIGLVIYVPHLATVDSVGDSVARTTAVAKKHPANTATFNLFYAFSAAGLDSAIKIGDPLDAVVTPSVPTTVKNVNALDAVKIYPNPSKDVLNITGLTLTDHISMYDMMGRSVASDWAITSEGLNTFAMKNIPEGSYIIVIKESNDNVKARVPVRKL